MMHNKSKWLDTGYRHFAKYGPEQLNIKRIAEEIQLPRTTFYNYFADKEDLINQLLQMYFDQAGKFKALVKERCKVYSPDLHLLLSEIPQTLKFSRQLFLHRQYPVYNLVLTSVRSRVNEYLLPLFLDYYQLNLHYKLATDFYECLLDSWYAKLNPDDLSAEAMQELTDQIMATMLSFAKTKLFMQIL